MDTYGSSTSWSPASEAAPAAAADEEPVDGPAGVDDASAYQQGRHEAGPMPADGTQAGTSGVPAEDGAAAGEADEVVVVETVRTDTGSGAYGVPGRPASTVSGSPASATAPGAGDSSAEWSEIKALFVDDPAASVRRASLLVEQAVEGFMSSLRERQESLGSWQEGDATGTEELRTSLRGYLGLFGQLEQMSGQFQSAGGGPAPDGSA